MGAFTWWRPPLPRRFWCPGRSCPPEFRRAAVLAVLPSSRRDVPVTGSMSDRIGRDATVMATMARRVVGYGLLSRRRSSTSGVPITVVGVGFVGPAMSYAPPQSRFMDLLSDAGAGFGSSGPPADLVDASGSVVVGVPTPPAGRSRQAARWRDGAQAGRAARESTVAARY